MSKSKTFHHSATVVTLFLLAVFAALAPAAHAQTFQVIHYFTGNGDDGTPQSGLTEYADGKFYGTTSGYELASDGSVFKLTSSGAGWELAPLTTFTQPGDRGARPDSQVVIGPSGILFGVTYLASEGDCLGNGSCGAVFELQPKPNRCASFNCYWNESAMHQFEALPDAGVPEGPVVFDRSGNLYGTTAYGGTGICYNDIHLNYGCGAVYQFIHSNNGWTYSVIFSFQGGTDGQGPAGGMIFDAAGNLYGTTQLGGSANCGTIFELSQSNGVWTKTILHNFQCTDGAGPWGNLIADQSGNFYGVAASGGANNGGVVFELSQPGNWTYSVLFNFAVNSYPEGTLVFDHSGNLYGTTNSGGAFGEGTAFKLTLANGVWTETDLHDFQTSEGAPPNGGLVLDSTGNLYGTSQLGGTGFNGPCYGVGCGTIWEITP